MTAGWRPALRLARRQLRGSRGRSLLVATMVGVPVLLTVALLTVVRTADVSAAEALPHELGSADAVVQPVARRPVPQRPDVLPEAPAHPREAASWSATEVHRLTGGRLLAMTEGDAVLRARGGGLVSSAVLEVDLHDPLTDGLLDVRSGRVPRHRDEVAVSPWLARHGLGLGTDTATRTGTSLHVVGVVARGADPGARLVVSLPRVVPTTAASDGTGTTTRYLLDRTRPVGWHEVRSLNRRGLTVLSRAVVLDPPPASQQYRAFDVGENAAQQTVLALVVAAVLLEVVLLAAPAFAVGVRRQRRRLALLGAAGAAPTQLRRVVLAEGLVLGAGASVLAALAGVGLARVAAAVVLARGWFAVGPFDVRLLDVLAPAALGTAAALVAAYVPARQAGRTAIMATLAGRRGATRTRWGWPVVGVVVAGAGALLTLSAVSGSGSETRVALGTVAVVLGVVLLVPAVVGAVGGLAACLPLPLRLAVRDASRQRARTAPAVAAVMATVVGVTALAIGSSSDFAQARRDYRPQLAVGALSAFVYDTGRAGAEEAAQVVRRATGRRPATVSEADLGSVAALLPGCHPRGRGHLSERCGEWDVPPGVATFSSGSPLVTTPEGLVALGARLDRSARRVLSSGGVLLLNPRTVDDTGHATLAVGRHSPRLSRVPAATAPGLMRSHDEAVTTLAMTPATARRVGLHATPSRVVLPPAHPGVTGKQQQRVGRALSTLGQGTSVYVERGFVRTYTLPFVALAVVGGLVVLAGTLTAGGLALADARPDLATLAAVGAAPGTRRLVAVGQALTIGVLGAGLGVVVGFLPGLAVTWPLTTGGYPRPDGPPVIDVPWTLLAVVVVGVPALAALAAGVFSGSRLPVVHRRDV